MANVAPDDDEVFTQPPRESDRLAVRYGPSEVISRVITDTAFQPFHLAKVLMQIGFEPLPPQPTWTLLTRQPRMAYPNVFKYLGYIRRRDGFFGIYRGLSGKVATSLSMGYVYSISNTYLIKNWSKPRDEARKNRRGNQSSRRDSLEEQIANMRDELPAFLDNLAVESCSRTLAIVASHPFHVITIRLCAQFVGNESDSALSMLWQDLTSGNLWSGLVPRLLADLLLLWGSHSVMFLVNGALGNRASKDSLIRNYIGTAVNFILTAHLYPYHLVSTVMAARDLPPERLSASLLNPPFDSWRECWSYLASTNQLKRGASPFWRYQVEVNRAVAYGRKF